MDINHVRSFVRLRSILGMARVGVCRPKRPKLMNSGEPPTPKPEGVTVTGVMFSDPESSGMPSPKACS